MPDARVNVTGNDGWRGTIDTSAWPLDGSKPEVMIELEDGRRFLTPVNSLVRQAEGGYRLLLGPTDLNRIEDALGVKGREQIVVPVIEEQLQVGTRIIESGVVRVTKTVRQRDEVVNPPLVKEEVSVERVPMNRPIEGPVQIREEGDTVVVPVVEEVVVVEKRLMLKEELRITRKRSETRQPQHVTVRSEEVQVERLPAAASTSVDT